MKLEVIRTDRFETSCVGELHIDGRRQCYTLEDTIREVASKPVEQWKIKGKTAIPRGTYKVILSMSNRFKELLPEVLNVPGYTGVRIHPGNTAEDTEGCILVGETKLTDKVGNSRKAFNKLMLRLKYAVSCKDDIYLVIK